MGTTNNHRQALIDSLDGLYAELVEEAKHVAKDFMAEASTIEGGTRRQVKILIQVKQHTPQSWGIYWAKNTATPGQPASPLTINKGAGDKYLMATFSSVREPLKTVCRTYEQRLALIRAACRQNRVLRRTLDAHVRQVAKALHNR
ncbi:conjugative transfer protein MobI(A/C) [Geopseudomonas aromaticivorans]